MRFLLILLFLTTISLTGFTQDLEKDNTEAQVSDTTISYAYISVLGRTLTKKLWVTVDFGDSPEQIKLGKEYYAALKSKKSYIAILNHMIKNQFELVQALDVTEGDIGVPSGIIYIMRKK